ncbi:MAG: YbbR-like domain-containing protein [Acidobacteriota bacterium]
MDLRKNLFLKLTAVAIGFGLWNWVESQGDLLKTVQVPVDLSGLPLDMEIVGVPPGDVSVRLRGPEVVLRTLAPEHVQVIPDFAGQPVHSGENFVPLTPEQVRVPAGIAVDQVLPNHLDIFLERTMTKEVPVHPAIHGDPASGYEVAGKVVQPARLAIEGPESMVSKVNFISTTPAISIESRDSNLRATVRPMPGGEPGNQVRLVDPGTRIDVMIRIRPIMKERRLTKVPVRLIGLDPEGPQPRVRPSRVTVELTGPVNLVDKVSAADLEAVVDLTGRPREDTDLAVTDLVVRPSHPEGPVLEGIDFTISSPDSVRIDW